MKDMTSNSQRWAYQAAAKIGGGTQESPKMTSGLFGFEGTGGKGEIVLQVRCSAEH